MMARTRAEVDALNQLARATAISAGEIHGPAVRIGDRDWQTGDLLRTRRNDRTLPVHLTRATFTEPSRRQGCDLC